MSTISPFDRDVYGFYGRTGDGPISLVLNDTTVLPNDRRLSPTSGLGSDARVGFLDDGMILALRTVDKNALPFLPSSIQDDLIRIDNGGSITMIDLEGIVNPAAVPFSEIRLMGEVTSARGPKGNGIEANALGSQFLTTNGDFLLRAIYTDDLGATQSGIYRSSDLQNIEMIIDLDELVDPVNGEAITNSRGEVIKDPIRFNIDDHGRATFVGWTASDESSYYAIVDGEVFRLVNQGEVVPGGRQIRDASGGSAGAFTNMSLTHAFIEDHFVFNARVRGLDGDYDEYALFSVDLTQLSNTLAGDFNDDGVIDEIDIDLLVSAITTQAGAGYDLDGSGSVDQGDLSYLVESVLETHFGDANLDGSVDLLDLSLLASHFSDEAGWAGGNGNTDQIVDLLDLSLLASNFGQSNNVIPEPAVLSVCTLAALVTIRRRRQ
ncbi:hypothetical protein [Mucisphaera calidilacus]|uniref:hypothetical protein n=1 Tax=Mucisphaera calidilacus TaxID=2527982 RepID=UPI001F3F06CD|nr:hypothetical protein [Mucisphaera calidilacus]